MLKIGTWKVFQDTPTQRLWRRGLIAANLLLQEEAEGTVEGARFERITRTLCLSNEVARTTALGRFTQLDSDIQKLLTTVLPAGCRLAVEDCAVSTGITAGEWYSLLRSDYPAVQFTASDWLLYLFEVRFDGARDTYIIQPNGTPIQYIRPPFVVSLTQLQSWFYALNRGVQGRALRKWNDSIARQLRIPEHWDDAIATKECGRYKLRRICLLHPEVLRLRDHQFQIKQHSVFTSLEEPIDVIRTMNILNRAYFSDTQLLSAVHAVRRSLKPGGIWIVGRTVAEDPPQNEVTVFRKVENGWDVLLRIGKGSEMEKIVSAGSRIAAANSLR